MRRFSVFFFLQVLASYIHGSKASSILYLVNCYYGIYCDVGSKEHERTKSSKILIKQDRFIVL